MTAVKESGVIEVFRITPQVMFSSLSFPTPMKESRQDWWQVYIKALAQTLVGNHGF